MLARGSGGFACLQWLAPLTNSLTSSFERRVVSKKLATSKVVRVMCSQFSALHISKSSETLFINYTKKVELHNVFHISTSILNVDFVNQRYLLYLVLVHNTRGTPGVCGYVYEYTPRDHQSQVRARKARSRTGTGTTQKFLCFRYVGTGLSTGGASAFEYHVVGLPRNSLHTYLVLKSEPSGNSAGCTEYAPAPRIHNLYALVLVSYHTSHVLLYLSFCLLWVSRAVPFF